MINYTEESVCINEEKSLEDDINGENFTDMNSS